MMISALLLTLLIVACGTDTAQDELSAIVYEGILVPAGRRGQAHAPIMAEVRRGNMTRTVDLPTTAVFTNVLGLGFDLYGGVLSGELGLSVGARVNRGDLIAEQFFEPTVQQTIARDRILLQMREFEARFLIDRDAREVAIAEARDALRYVRESDDERILTLQLERLEILFQRFMFDAGERRRELNERLEEATLPPERLYAPFCGVVTGLGTISHDATVQRGQNLFWVADDNNFYFRVTAPPNVIRFGNVYPIRMRDSNLTFDAKVVSDPVAAGTWDALMDFILMPVELGAFREELERLGLSYFEMVTGRSFHFIVEEVIAYDVLLLPLQFIRSENNLSYVYIYENGSYLKRYVTLGLQFMGEAEILIGLEEGSKVVLI